MPAELILPRLQMLPCSGLILILINHDWWWPSDSLKEGAFGEHRDLTTGGLASFLRPPRDARSSAIRDKKRVSAGYPLAPFALCAHCVEGVANGALEERSFDAIVRRAFSSFERLTKIRSRAYCKIHHIFVRHTLLA